MASIRRDRGIAADATVVNPGDFALIRKISEAQQRWQKPAWKHYAKLPEVHYPANFFGWALSRFDLRIGRKTVREGQVVIEDSNDQLGWEALAALDEGDGLAELSRLYGINMTIAADCWLIGRDVNGVTEWKLWSTEEVELRASNFDVQSPGRPLIYVDGEPLGTGDFARRIWKSNPQKRIQADGAMEALDLPCTQLKDLYDAITAQIQSRLASAGLLFLPNSIQVPGATSRPNGTGPLAQDPVLNNLVLAMLAGIQNRDSAAGRIPILLRGPDGAGESIKHITLDRILSEQEMTLRAELRSEIAQGLDMPKEQVEGMGEGTNHWTSWAIRDDTYRNHLKPVGDAWAMALTRVYLRPYLQAAGATEEQLRDLVIYGDGSQLIARANESEELDRLRDQGGVKLQTMRSKAGLNETDAPDDEEYVRWIGAKAADPYLATFGLDVAEKIDWTKVRGGGPKPGPDASALPNQRNRPTVSNGNTTAGRPGGGAGGNAGGVAGRGRAAELAPAMLVAYKASFPTIGARLRARFVNDPALADRLRKVPNQKIHEALATTEQTIARQAVSGIVGPMLEELAEPAELAAAIERLEDRLTVDVALGIAPSLTLGEALDMIGELDQEMNDAA